MGIATTLFPPFPHALKHSKWIFHTKKIKNKLWSTHRKFTCICIPLFFFMLFDSLSHLLCFADQAAVQQ